MKYWRGYLVALILSVSSWALLQFAASHMVLMDMVYPYMTRLVQGNLATWSSGVNFCLWQLWVLVLVGGVAASIVLMVVLKWNPIQWFGWVMAAVSVIALLNTAVQGMNQYTGSIADDMRFKDDNCSVLSVEDAAEYYLKHAQAVSAKAGTMGYDLDELNAKAPDGFKTLTYRERYAIFAGSTLPVKKLGWSSRYTKQGITGITIYATGESAVNMETPQALLPYAICREMCIRMSIAREPDVDFAAILACIYNEDPRFQYAGYLMAYIQCLDGLNGLNTDKSKAAIERLERAPGEIINADLSLWRGFTQNREKGDTAATLLTNWHIHTVVLPQEALKNAEDEAIFDPMDENHPNLVGIVS